MTDTLPPGYEAQPVWQFRDDSGTYTYEFYRVYRPAHEDQRGPVEVEDEQASFWTVTWAEADETDVHARSRSITYEEARRAWRRPLKFTEFASPDDMRDVLPKLLHPGESMFIGIDSR